jgi:hypothetical protein
MLRVARGLADTLYSGEYSDMNMTLRLAEPLAAPTAVDGEIDRLVAIIAQHARAARIDVRGDTSHEGRDRRRWTAAKALLAEIAAGRVLPQPESGPDDLTTAIGRLYELWPAASTATYLDVHDLQAGAALKMLGSRQPTCI